MILHALLLFMCFLASNASHLESATSNPEPLKFTVHEGDSYHLPCSQNEFTTIRGCHLIKPNAKVYGFFEGSNWEMGRIETTIEPTKCGAKVQSAAKDDEGVWECNVALQLEHESLRITKEISVIVLPSPSKQVTNLADIFL